MLQTDPRTHSLAAATRRDAGVRWPPGQIRGGVRSVRTRSTAAAEAAFLYSGVGGPGLVTGSRELIGSVSLGQCGVAATPPHRHSLHIAANWPASASRPSLGRYHNVATTQPLSNLRPVILLPCFDAVGWAAGRASGL